MGLKILWTSLVFYGLQAVAHPCDTAFLEAQNSIEKEFILSDFDYHVWGSQHTKNGTVILVHGLGSAWQTFAEFAPKLANQYQVIAYSQVGHGNSWGDRLDFSNQTLAKDLAQLMKLLDIHSAHLVGHSMGARTALKFAELFPNQVRSLVLEDHEFKARRSTMPDYPISDLEDLRKFPKELNLKNLP